MRFRRLFCLARRPSSCTFVQEGSASTGTVDSTLTAGYACRRGEVDPTAR